MNISTLGGKKDKDYLLYTLKAGQSQNLEHTNTFGGQVLVLVGNTSITNGNKNDIYLQLPH